MVRLQTRHVFWLALGFAAATASSLSLYIGLKQSVWFDEAYSILLAKHSWGDIVRLTAQDVHPPVYYWLLKAWMLLFGSGELALRSLSILFLGLSIVMAGMLMRKLFNAKTALLAMPFLVFAPFLLRYGFEIRMYALCSFLGVAATYVLVSAVEEKKARRRQVLFLIYALLVALGVYTLYFMTLIWMAHAVWLGWKIYKDRRHDLMKPVVVSYLFAFLLFIPWLPVFLGKAGGGTLSRVTQALGVENLYGAGTFLFLYRPSWDTTPITLFGVAAGVGATAYLALRAYRSGSPKERRSLLLLGTYWIVPIVVLIVVTHIKPVYLERYLAHYAIGVYMSIGVLAALALQRPGKFARAAVGVVAATLLAGCVSLAGYGNYNFQRVHIPSVKQAAAQLTDCKNGAIVFADGPQLAMELMYYETDCPVYFFNETLEMGGGFAMISSSPLRVANASELPDTNEILHVYYNKPKNTLPPTFHRVNVKTEQKLSVAVYRTASQ